MGLRTKSAQKQHRQSLKRRDRNRFVTSTLKTKLKRYSEAPGGEDMEKSQALLKELVSLADKARHKRGSPQKESIEIRIEVLKEAFRPRPGR